MRCAWRSAEASAAEGRTRGSLPCRAGGCGGTTRQTSQLSWPCGQRPAHLSSASSIAFVGCSPLGSFFSQVSTICREAFICWSRNTPIEKVLHWPVAEAATACSAARARAACMRSANGPQAICCELCSGPMAPQITPTFTATGWAPSIPRNTRPNEPLHRWGRQGRVRARGSALCKRLPFRPANPSKPAQQCRLVGQTTQRWHAHPAPPAAPAPT